MYSEFAHGLHLLLVLEHDCDRVELDGNYQSLLEIEIGDDESNCRSLLMMSHWFESTRRRYVFVVVYQRVCVSCIDA